MAVFTQLDDDILLCILEHSCNDLKTTSSIPLVSRRLFVLCKTSDRYISTSTYLQLRLHHAYGPPYLHSTPFLRKYIERFQLLNHNLSSDPAKLISHQTHPFTLDISDWGHTPCSIVSNFIFFLEEVPALRVKCYDMDRSMEIVWEGAVSESVCGSGESTPSIEANLHVDLNGDAPPSIVRLLISGEAEMIVTTFDLKLLPGGSSTLIERESRILELCDDDVGSGNLVNDWILPDLSTPYQVVNTDTGYVFPIVNDPPGSRPMKSIAINARCFMSLLRPILGTEVLIPSHLAIYEFPDPHSPDVQEAIQPVHVMKLPKQLRDIVLLDPSSIRHHGDHTTGSLAFTQEIVHILGCNSEERILVDVALPSPLCPTPVLTTKSVSLGDNERGYTDLGQHRRRIYRHTTYSTEFSLSQAALVHEPGSATYGVGRASMLESPAELMGTTDSPTYVSILAFDDVRGRVYLVIDHTQLDEIDQPESPRHFVLHILDYV